MQLSQVKIGDWVTVVGVATSKKQSQAYRRKLLAIGLIPGCNFKLVAKAPLGDPIQLELENGFNISLRESEASILKLAIMPKDASPLVGAINGK